MHALVCRYIVRGKVSKLALLLLIASLISRATGSTSKTGGVDGSVVSVNVGLQWRRGVPSALIRI